MKKKFLLLIYLLLAAFYCQGKDYYVSFWMMNSEIKNSLKENERQKELKKNEDSNLALETSNQKQWSKLRKTVKKIQDRLAIVDFALQSIPTGVVISRKFGEIKRTQENIIREMNTLTPALFKVFRREVKFVNDLQMVARLMVGIVASYGAINQMERAERKILLDYALEEVDKLKSNSSYTLFLIREAKYNLKMSRMKFNYYVNRDKQLVKDIITDIKKI